MSFGKGFQKGMNAFGQCIAIIINSVLLTLVYFIGIGITAIICKIFRKQFLDLKPDKNAITYWSDIDLKKRPIKEHYRQF